MKKKILSLIVSVMVYFPFQLMAQSSFPLSDPINLYENGKYCFGQKDYAVARQSLNEFIQNETDGDLLQEAEYMLACIAYERNPENSINVLRAYLEKYPDSRHTNKIYSLIASAYFYEKKYDEAIAVFNSCILEQLGTQERDEAIYCLATSYVKVDRLRDAAIWFGTLREISSKYREDAIYNLSYIDYAQKRYDSALSGFLSLQDDKKYKELVPYYIAEIYLLRKNYDKSEIVAQNYLSAYPHNGNVFEMERILGESQYFMGYYEKAITHLANYVSSVSTPSRNVLYLLAMSYYRTQVFSDAARIFAETTMIKDPLTQNAYLHLGLSYLELRDKNKARMAFEQAASMDFNKQIKEQAFYNYALCIHETSYSAFSQSVTVFERFLNEFPNSQYAEKVSDYLVEVYMNTRSYEAALKSIAKISHPGIRILEAKQKILFQLGTQAFVNAGFDEAIVYFNRSLELSRYNVQTKANAYYWRGESYYRLGRYDEAARNFHLYFEFTEMKNADMYSLAFYNLGYIAFKEKNYSGALNWFNKYINMAGEESKTLLADAYNRAGDCNFFSRNFSEARTDYSKAVQLDPSLGDYSLYQEALVLGLQKDYLGKIQSLNKLIGSYPESQYQDDALYERGRAYVQMEDNSRAVDSFNELLRKFPESAISRKAANEIGLLYYQNDNYKEAIKAYKYVLTTYPGSEEARLAQRDLKSIYIDLNKVDEYADFASSIPGGVSFDVTERDSLTYIAAEKVYMRGEIKEAKNSFARYLQMFPEGAFSLNAHYYIGLTDYNQKNYSDALTHFEKVMEYPNNKFSEDAMIISGEILFNSKDYTKSLAVYKRLKEKASTIDRVRLAEIGVMRSAYLNKDEKEVINAVTSLLADSKLPPELVNEAKYYRAKAYLGQKAITEAMTDLKELSKDTRNPYGAEAKYLMAQLYYDSGDMDLAEKEILDYIEMSTPHAYWLARGFVLLSDVYVKMDRKLEAKQYLLSLQQNYKIDDDIPVMIDSRLKKLNK